MALMIVFFFVLMVAAAIAGTVMAKCRNPIAKVVITLVTYVICMGIELSIITHIS